VRSRSLGNQPEAGALPFSQAEGRGRKGSKKPVTIKPSALGLRILRLLEVAGLTRKVTIKLTTTDTAPGHAPQTMTRTIRVI
jgi:hypothetical protein